MEPKSNDINPNVIADMKSHSKKEMLEWIDKRIEAKKQALISDKSLDKTLDQALLDELKALKEVRILYEYNDKEEFKNQYRIDDESRNLSPIPIAFLALIIGIVVFLFWARLNWTFIELDITSSSVKFITAEVAGLQPIIKDLDFEKIGFNNFGSLETANKRLDTEGSTPFRLNVKSEADSYVTLEEFFVPENSTVYLSTPEESGGVAKESGAVYFLKSGEAGAVYLSTLEEQKVYEAAVILCESLLPKEDGGTSSQVVNQENQPCTDELVLELELNNIEATQPFKDQFEDGSLVIGLSPYRTIAKILRFNFKPLNESPRLAQQTQISSLNFMRFDNLSDTQRVRGELVSGIESGTIYYEGLAGTERDKRELRPGERLQFGAAQGTLRAIELENGLIHIQFRGTVRQMRTGSHSLMPTYIERFRANDVFKALVAGLVTLLGGGLVTWILDRIRERKRESV
jgi:hypothetical protein